MSFEEARRHLESLGIDAMKAQRPSMHRIVALLEALDHPEQRVPAIHVTGTNGKTSTVRVAASLLGAAGLTAGTFTSPHLQSVTERISIGGQPIEPDEFASVFEHLKPYVDVVEGQLGEQVTYFELLTAMFYLWSAEAPVDALVVEVGLGGRWDATNVVPAPVAVLTNIGLDHIELLGPTRADVAREKSGIIKDQAEVVIGELDPEMIKIITDHADEKMARTGVLERDFSLVSNATAIGGRYLTLRTSRRTYEDVFLPLHGAHQGTNALLALEAVTRFIPAQELDEEVVAEAFANVALPGRLEHLTVGETPVVLDVAHNPEGVAALIRSLTESFAFTQVVFVVGILSDKDRRGILAELARVPGTVLLTEPASSRALARSELAATAQELALDHEEVEGVPAAVSRALDLAGEQGLVCVTGSHYLVGEARTFLTN